MYHAIHAVQAGHYILLKHLHFSSIHLTYFLPLTMDTNAAPHTKAEGTAPAVPPAPKGVQERTFQTASAIRNYFSSKKTPKVKVSSSPLKFPWKKTAPKSFLALAKPGANIDDRKEDFRDGINTLSKEAEEDPGSEVARKINETTLNLFYQPTRTTPERSNYTDLPDPEAVFRDLLQSNSLPRENESGISSMTYAVGTLLSISLFRAGPNGLNDNNTSPYFDLSPLYGSEEEESDAIRSKEGRGMLAPDCFYDDRAPILPNSVVVLLILLNRNHNYIAHRLLINDKGQKWVDPSTVEDTRMINCAHFRNIIMCDFMKGLLGLPTVGPRAGLDILVDSSGYPLKGEGVNPSIESTFLYNFSHLMSQADVQAFDKVIQRVQKNPDVVSQADYEEVANVLCYQGDHNRRRRDHANLHRGRDAYFKDDELARILYHATETPSIAPGSGVPASMKPIELKTLQRAREGNVCSLNDYRKHLGLKPYTSFLEWNPNPQIAQAAEKLYRGDINKLELYPGLQAEAVPRDRGFGIGYTATYALLIDLTYRIRNDPKLTTELNESNITSWGVNDCNPENHIGSGTGAMLPRIFQRTLPRNYPYDSLYTLFPFSTPPAAAEALRKWPKINSFTEGRPQTSPIHTITSKDTISYIFNNPDKYTTPYGPDLKKLTNGYGFLLGFDDAPLHDRDQMMMLYALIPDAGALNRYARTLRNIATEYIQDRSSFHKESNSSTIDIINDVINAVCTRWVCETLCDYPLGKDGKKGLDVEKRRLEERSFHEKYAALYLFVFRNLESEAGWDIHKRAMEYSEELRLDISRKIPEPVHEDDKNYFQFLKNSVFAFLGFWRRVQEELKGKPLPDETAQTFLMRLVRASRNISIEEFRDHQEFVKLLSGKDSESQNDVLNQSRLVATILGLAVVTAVSYSQVCAQAVSYYLAPGREAKLKEIIDLCTSLHPKPHDNAVLMGFIREAQISDQKLGIWRHVAVEDILTHDGSEIKVHPGDRIYADITTAHKNLLPIVTQTQDGKGDKEYTVKPVQTIQGMGLHKCSGMTFVDQTMPEIFRAIFRLPGIRSASQKDGQSVKIEALFDFNGTAPVSFLNSDGTITYYPKNLLIEYNGEPGESMRKKKKDRWNVKPGSVTQKLREVTDRMMVLIGILLVALLVLVILARLGLLVRNQARKMRKRLSDQDVQHEHVDCPAPITAMHPWQNNSFTAGGDGHPIPIEYTLDLPVAHRLSFVDVDKKDVRMSVEVDNVLRGFARDFELNKTEDCGDNIGLCLNNGFSAGLVVIPPGKHTVRIDWQGKENLPEEWGDEKFRRIFWYRELCGGQ
ncbi:hypothetical protein BDQ17DRAFT_1407526 [Cyathus striatus]|nr:hypothetical protein BDQ17DRAFT_1407526 [Cyathus striatus]